MNTQCTGEQLEFHALGRRLVTGRFDGGRISSDAGGVLLREVDERIGLTARVSRSLVDYRNPASVEHSVHELVSQRLYAIALGYEDLNDHGELRCDAVLSLLVGKRDVTGEKRIRERDRGYPICVSRRCPPRVPFRFSCAGVRTLHSPSPPGVSSPQLGAMLSESLRPVFPGSSVRRALAPHSS